MEIGAYASLNQSNLLLEGSGIQKAAFSDQRDTEIFMIPLLEGSEVSQLALESRACGLLEISTELLKYRKSVKPRGIVSYASSRDGTRSPPGYVYQVLMGTVGTAFTWTHPAEFSSMNTDMFISVLTPNDLFNCKELGENWEENIQYKLYTFTNLV